MYWMIVLNNTELISVVRHIAELYIIKTVEAYAFNSLYLANILLNQATALEFHFHLHFDRF